MPEFKFRLPRAPLDGTPDVAILAGIKPVKSDPNYAAAKAGDALQAAALIRNLITADEVARVRKLLDGRHPILSPVHAVETAGVNEIPLALAAAVAHALTLEVEASVVQLNTAGHTGAGGW